MKKSISIFTLAVALGIGVSSCNTAEENQAPHINIIKPTAADNPHMSGMPISIQVEVSDDEQLHDTEISIVRAHDSAEVYHQYTHTHEAQFTISEDTVLTTSMHSDFTITVTAEDHDGEVTTASSTFHMHPM